MRRLPFALSTLGLVVLLAGPAAAGDQKAGAGKGRHNHSAHAFSFPKQIQLTSEQQAKLDELKKQYGPKLAEADSKVAAVLTPERRKVAHEAAKKAKAEGKKGKERLEAVKAALNLPSDEQAKLKDAFSARAKLMKEIRTQKLAILTDEQKTELKAMHKGKKAKAAAST